MSQHIGFHYVELQDTQPSLVWRRMREEREEPQMASQNCASIIQVSNLAGRPA